MLIKRLIKLLYIVLFIVVLVLGFIEVNRIINARNINTKVVEKTKKIGPYTVYTNQNEYMK